MKNVSRINAELKLLCQVFGEKAVTWADNYDWVRIEGVPLPPKFNKPCTNLLILIPENYGHGEPLKDVFVDPDLRICHDGQWVEIPHYFPDMRGPIARKFEKHYGKNWRYLCLHQERWDPQSDSLFGYVQQIYVYLSDPFAWEERK